MTLEGTGDSSVLLFHLHVSNSLILLHSFNMSLSGRYTLYAVGINLLAPELFF